ncbi:MAG: patatin-like phospholipase family protein [Bacteroidetes bacterium]|nr:patatin-like phospholipase family protein [Bacteroidota bacterium]
MKKYLAGFYYSLPVQLFLLHFRRYQVLLVFWYILFATISGNFLHTYGAHTLFLSPEYLGNVNAFSTGLVGFSVGVFFMSWNITTFILHTKHIQFLATTEQPFLKFCINNSVIPLAFLIFYFFYAIDYNSTQELVSPGGILVLCLGFIGGIIVAILIALLYFFGADKSISRRMGTVITTAHKNYERAIRRKKNQETSNHGIRVDWFLTTRLGLRKPRDVQHYSQGFLDSIFKRHHFSAVLAILTAFIFLLIMGYFTDTTIFQLPAAASITAFFSILIALAGAVSLFLGNWSLPLLFLVYFLLNSLYQSHIIDPRSKAYGLDYTHKKEAPAYSLENMDSMVSQANLEADKNIYITMLNNWKRRQASDSPVIFIINVSGGGTRSATFTMEVLQKLDSLTQGNLMKQTILITGASGGMIGATYFRSLYLAQQKDSSIDLYDKKYATTISKDLLNPVFSSFVSRDLVGPVKKVNINGYDYIRDRGYSFEEKLNFNTRGILNKKLGDFMQDEYTGKAPILFFNTIITGDAREMFIGTHPARFLMQASSDSSGFISTDIDAIDYVSFFKNQNPLNLRMLTAIRMNATFPYVLPNVWLPTKPAVDVMDGGLRDNFGQEISMRFMNTFKDWLHTNTSRVVLIQIRDTKTGDWDGPYDPGSIFGFITKPLEVLQNNWFRLQDYHQSDELNYFSSSFGLSFSKILFQYIPSNKERSASLSFHLTTSEKLDIDNALNNEINAKSFEEIQRLLTNTRVP